MMQSKSITPTVEEVFNENDNNDVNDDLNDDSINLFKCNFFELFR